MHLFGNLTTFKKIQHLNQGTNIEQYQHGGTVLFELDDQCSEISTYLKRKKKRKGKKGKHPRTGQEGQEGEQRYSSALSLTLALDGGGWSTPRPGSCTSGQDPVPVVKKRRKERNLATGPFQIQVIGMHLIMR